MTDTIDTILAEIDASLEDDRDELIRDGETITTDAATAMCKRIARAAEPDKLIAKGLTWAVFSGGDGGAEFVLQSKASDRRATFGITAGGRMRWDIPPVPERPITIDENNKTNTCPFDSAWDETQLVQETTAWVVG